MNIAINRRTLVSTAAVTAVGAGSPRAAERSTLDELLTAYYRTEAEYLAESEAADRADRAFKEAYPTEEVYRRADTTQERLDHHIGMAAQTIAEQRDWDWETAARFRSACQTLERHFLNDVPRPGAEAMREHVIASDDSVDEAYRRHLGVRELLFCYPPASLDEVSRKNAFLLELLRQRYEFFDYELEMLFGGDVETSAAQRTRHT